MLAAMHFAGWQLWMAAALLFAGGELLHGSLWLLAIAIACVPAALASAAGAGPALQLLLFGLAGFAQVPLLVWRLGKRRAAKRLATNAEAIVGKRVRVLQPVREDQDGVVLLTGEHWKARSLAGELQPGAEAQVVQREGLCLFVVPFER